MRERGRLKRSRARPGVATPLGKRTVMSKSPLVLGLIASTLIVVISE